ncbi:hypothetical protein [Streptomyces sulphureus]|uniref:hypothetical protein n=1 Tax=Streptomyces sulphureus TaxID=47758 RepID=UPI001B7FBCE9|nr:hypothetical protein [Streptomyces sulphureus]
MASSSTSPSRRPLFEGDQGRRSSRWRRIPKDADSGREARSPHSLISSRLCAVETTAQGHTSRTAVTEHRHSATSGGGVEDRLHLGRVDVLAAAQDEVGAPAADTQQTVPHGAQVAGAQPAVRGVSRVARGTLQ